jgi:hypothetical protein
LARAGLQGLWSYPDAGHSPGVPEDQVPNLNHLNQSLPKPLAVSVPEAMRLSGYSRTGLYRRLASGEIIGRKVGRSLLILVDSLERSVNALPRAEFTPEKTA